MQKPDRPVPKSRSSRAQSEESQQPEDNIEPYKVVIKKQKPKKSVVERLIEKGLLEPSRVKTPETTATALTSEVNENDNNIITNPFQQPEFFDLSEHSTTSSTVEPSDWSLSSPISDPISDLSVSDLEYQPDSLPKFEESPVIKSSKGTWSFTSYVNEVVLIVGEKENEENDIMLPINESTLEEVPMVPNDSPVCHEYDQDAKVSTIESNNMEFMSFPTKINNNNNKKTRFCRRGRYAKRCLDKALEGLKSANKKNNNKPRLLGRGHYFERIVKRSLGCVQQDKETRYDRSSSEESFLRLIMFASLANSLRDTYDNEILHRGSSRRNSRRMSYRRDSNASNCCPLENGFFAYKPSSFYTKEQDTFSSRCKEGRRRLSVMSMVVADKVGNAIRSDIARGVAYALVPCASALAFFMYNYVKRINNNHE